MKARVVIMTVILLLCFCVFSVPCRAEIVSITPPVIDVFDNGEEDNSVPVEDNSEDIREGVVLENEDLGMLEVIVVDDTLYFGIRVEDISWVVDILIFLTCLFAGFIYFLLDAFFKR